MPNPYLQQLQSQGIQPANPGGSTNPYLQKLQSMGIQPQNQAQDQRQVAIEQGDAVSSERRYERTGKVEPTFLGGVVRDLGQLAMKPVSSAISAGRALTPGQAQENIYNPIQSSYFGDIYGVGLKPQYDIQERQQAGEDVTASDMRKASMKGLVQGAGYGAELGSVIAGTGATTGLKGVGQQGIKQVIKNAAKHIAAEAVAGLSGGLGYAVQQEDASVGSVIGSGALGLAAGATLATALPIIGNSVRNVLAKRIGAEAAENATQSFAREIPKYEARVNKFSEFLGDRQSNAAKTYNLELTRNTKDFAGMTPEQRNSLALKQHASNLDSVLQDTNLAVGGKFNAPEISDAVLFKRDSFMDSVMNVFRGSSEPVNLITADIKKSIDDAIRYSSSVNKNIQGEVGNLTTKLQKRLARIFEERGITGGNAKLSDLIDIYQKTDVKYKGGDPLSSRANAENLALRKAIMNIIERGSPSKQVIDTFKTANKVYGSLTETSQWAKKMGNAKLSKLDSFMLRAGAGFGALQALPALGPFGFIIGAQGAGALSEVALDAWINTFTKPGKALKALANQKQAATRGALQGIEKTGLNREIVNTALSGQSTQAGGPLEKSARRFLNRSAREEQFSTKAIQKNVDALTSETSKVVSEVEDNVKNIFSDIVSARNHDEILPLYSELQSELQTLKELSSEIKANKRSIFNRKNKVTGKLLKNDDVQRTEIGLEVVQQRLQKLINDIESSIPNLSQLNYSTPLIGEASTAPMQMGGDVVPQVGRTNRPSGLFR